MNPVKTIGRYQFPIGSVVMVEKRTGIRAFFKPGYDVLLASGVVLRMTETEKQELDEARGLHQKVLEVGAMIAALQKNNQPVQA